MLEVTLLRHGQTDANLNGILQGSGLDLDLNDEGKIQAQKAAEHLKNAGFHRAFSSPLLRARNTAEAILKYHQCSLIIEPLISERSYGELEGFSVSEHHRQRESAGIDQFKYQPKGGEAWPDVIKRAELFREMLENLYRVDETQKVLIVGHGGFNRAFLAAVQGLPVREIMRFDQANACINLTSFSFNRWTIFHTNLTAHLD
jgi:broad specificity phosphatase PhoE